MNDNGRDFMKGFFWAWFFSGPMYVPVGAIVTFALGLVVVASVIGWSWWVPVVVVILAVLCGLEVERIK